MIYIEYFSRREHISLAAYHQAVVQGQHGWDAAYANDHLIWNAGRTWRLGPHPEYIAVWHSADAGFERFSAWEAAFRSGEADPYEEPFRQAARIDMAGCYQDLFVPIPARNGIYYAEFFRIAGNHQAIRALFEARKNQHARFTLNLLVCRIGRLGPEPGGLAVWTLPDFAALTEIAEELDMVNQPVELMSAGTYMDVGQEIV
jgi:hypothetical protein